MKRAAIQVLDYLPIYASVYALQLIALVSIAFARLPAGWQLPFLFIWGASLALSLRIGWRRRHRTAGAGQLAQLMPLAISLAVMAVWIPMFGGDLMPIGFLLGILLGRNAMLSTRRALYVDLAIALVLFHASLGEQKTWLFAAIDVAFLVALVFVLMADYADRRLAFVHASDADARAALAPGLLNAALATTMVLAMAGFIYLLLPQLVPLDFGLPDTESKGSVRAFTGQGGTRNNNTQQQQGENGSAAPGSGAAGPGAASDGPVQLDVAGDDGPPSAGSGGEADQPRVILYVDAPHPLYVRTRMFVAPLGRSWAESPVPARPVPGNGRFILRRGDQREGITQHYRINRNHESRIPAAFLPARLSFPATGIGLGPDHALHAGGPLERGTRYSVISELKYQNGRPAGGPESAPRRGYRLLPPEQERLRELAANIVARTDQTPWRRADALEAHLRANYTRGTFKAGDTDPAAGFLFEQRRGGASQFGSTLALLLRASGIDSRVVSGYRARRLNPLHGDYEIWDEDRHTWVEAYLDGRWTVFDPSPWSAVPAPAAPESTWDAAQEYVRLARTDDFGNPIPVPRRPIDAYLYLVLAWGWLATFGPWVLFGIAVAGLLVWRLRNVLRPVFDSIDLLWLRLAGGRSYASVFAAFRAIERVFARRGFARGADENHAEYLARLAAAHPHLEAPIAFVRESFATARYGRNAATVKVKPTLDACRSIIALVDFKPASLKTVL